MHWYAGNVGTGLAALPQRRRREIPGLFTARALGARERASYGVPGGRTCRSRSPSGARTPTVAATTFPVSTADRAPAGSQIRGPVRRRVVRELHGAGRDGGPLARAAQQQLPRRQIDATERSVHMVNDTPRWGYKAMQIAHFLAAGGDTMVQAAQSGTFGAALKAHASVHANGDIAVMMTNTNKNVAANVTLNLTGGNARACVGTRYAYTPVNNDQDGDLDRRRIFANTATECRCPSLVPALVVGRRRLPEEVVAPRCAAAPLHNLVKLSAAPPTLMAVMMCARRLAASRVDVSACRVDGRARRVGRRVLRRPDRQRFEPGTMAAPFATLQRGHDARRPATRSGSAAAPTVPRPASGERRHTCSRRAAPRTRTASSSGRSRARCRCSTSRSCSSTTGRTTAGFCVTGSWLHFKGLEIAERADEHGRPTTASGTRLDQQPRRNNTFERSTCTTTRGNGMFIGNKERRRPPDPQLRLARQLRSELAARATARTPTASASTTRRRADARSSAAAAPGGTPTTATTSISQEVPVTVENSWAIRTATPIRRRAPADGNGNGFKMGSSQTGIRHMVRNNVAWKNKASGFYANHSTGGNTWYNNTSYMNGTQYNMLASASILGNVDGDHHAVGRAGPHHAQQHRLPEQEQQHGRRRHHVQHLGPRHHATASTRLREHERTPACTWAPREADGSLPPRQLHAARGAAAR